MRTRPIAISHPRNTLQWRDVGYGPAQVFHVLILLFVAVMLRYQAATSPTVLVPVFLLTAWMAL